MLDPRDIPGRERAAYNALLFAEHILGASRASRWLGAKRIDVQRRMATHLARRATGTRYQVDRVEGLTPEAFHRQYQRRGRPVVLAGAAKHWPCMGRWDLDYFRAQHGEVEIRLADSEGINGHHLKGHEEVLPMHEIIDRIEAGGPEYIRFEPFLEQSGTLEAELDVPMLEALRAPGSFGSGYHLFMGGAGTVTYLHNAVTSNLFVQVYGPKRWFLYPAFYTPVIQPPAKRSAYNYSYVDIHDPDPEAFPAFEHIDGYVVDLEPGDILYNPPFMWHQVENASPSIGLAYRYSDARRALSASPMLSLLRLLGTNPPVWRALLLKLQGKPIYDHAYQGPEDTSAQ